MSEPTLREEIFANNTTLFRQLDELDITSIGRDLDGLRDSVASTAEQIVSLGRIVDVNQGINNERYITTQTELTGITSELETLTTRVSQINTQLAPIYTRLTTLETNVDLLQFQYNNQVVSINTLTGRVNTLTSDVSTLRSEVNTLSATTSSNTTKIAANTATLKFFEDKFNSIPLSYEQLYFSTAYVLPNVYYTVLTVKGQPFENTLITGPAAAAHGRITMDGYFRANFIGRDYQFMWFYDIENPKVATANGSNSMVPIGRTLGLRADLPGGSIDEHVRVVKTRL